MQRYDNPLAVLLKGSLAGLVGTVVLSASMGRLAERLKDLGLDASAAAGAEASSADEQAEGEGPSADEAPTAQLAGRIAAGVLEQPIEQPTREKAGQAIHWGYGMAWGAAYGLLQSSLRWPHLLHGTLFGAILAVLGWQIEGGLGIAPPPTKQPLSTNVAAFVAHLLYGWTTALVFRVLSPRP